LVDADLVKNRLDLNRRNDGLGQEAGNSTAKIKPREVSLVDNDIELIATLPGSRSAVDNFPSAYRNSRVKVLFKKFLYECLSRRSLVQ
jgi:hypothetical protein